MIRTQAERTPGTLKTLWEDARNDLRTLEADAAADARMVARRIAALIKAG